VVTIVTVFQERGKLIQMSETIGSNRLVGCGCDGGGGLTGDKEVRFVSCLKNVSVDNRSQLFLEKQNIPMNGKCVSGFLFGTLAVHFCLVVYCCSEETWS